MSSRIRTQTVLIGAVPLLFLVLLLLCALMVQSRNAVIAASSQRSAQVISTSDHAIRLVDDAGRAIVAYQHSRKPAALGPYYTMRNELPATLNALQKMAQPYATEKALAGRLTADLRSGETLLATYLRAIQANDKAAQKRLIASPATRRLSTDLATALEAFNNEERVNTSKRMRDIHAQVERFTILLVVLCLTGIAITLVVSFRYGVTIAGRLMRLAENARRLAAGEATEPIRGDDEIAQLDRVYQEMTRRIQREHHTASVLQRALLPQDLPQLPGVRLDAAYVPAAGSAEVGGDWYDVFPISERVIGISIGDVAGHGLRASALMGCARQAIRTLAYVYDDPATVMEHVNGVLCRNDGAVLVTSFFATLNLDDGRLRYSLAGHPAPAKVLPDGRVEPLSGVGFVLGIDSGASFETFEASLAPGCGLVLYTDGVVELERDYFKGLENLHEAIGDEHHNAGANIAEAIQGRIFAKTPPSDDSALLFIGITSLGAAAQANRRAWRIDARDEYQARGVKRALLWEIGVLAKRGADLSAAELVLSELLGNVARHTPGPAEVSVEWDGEHTTICVEDCGERFEPAQRQPSDVLDEGGRGLFLAQALSRDLRVEWIGNGNRVTAVLALPLRPEQPVRPGAVRAPA